MQVLFFFRLRMSSSTSSMESASDEGVSCDLDLSDGSIMISSNSGKFSLGISLSEGECVKSVGSSDSGDDETIRTKGIINSKTEVNAYSTDEDLCFPREERYEYNLEGNRVIRMRYKRNKAKVAYGVVYRCKGQELVFLYVDEKQENLWIRIYLLCICK